MLVTSIFSFSQNVFNSLLSHCCYKSGLCGRRLKPLSQIMIQIFSFLRFWFVFIVIFNSQKLVVEKLGKDLIEKKPNNPPQSLQVFIVKFFFCNTVSHGGLDKCTCKGKGCYLNLGSLFTTHSQEHSCSRFVWANGRAAGIGRTVPVRSIGRLPAEIPKQNGRSS